LPSQVTFAFPVTILNDGLKPVVVLNYELTPINCEYQYTFRGQDGDQGLFESPPDSIPLTLPIVIEPGQGRTLFIKSAVVITYRASGFILDSVPPRTLRELSIRTITAQGRGYGVFEGEDMFGNAIEYGIGMRGSFSWNFLKPDSIIQPVYRLTVISARGRRYQTEFAPYPIRLRRRFRCDLGPFSKEPELQIPESWLYLDNALPSPL
jgi:hypothetical protein